MPRVFLCNCARFNLSNIARRISQIICAATGAEALLPLEKSIAHWEAQRRQAIISLYVTCGIEVAALILIDRLWCKKEYAQIRAQKEMIRRRQERMEEKARRASAG